LLEKFGLFIFIHVFIFFAALSLAKRKFICSIKRLIGRRNYAVCGGAAFLDVHLLNPLCYVPLSYGLHMNNRISPSLLTVQCYLLMQPFIELLCSKP
jgi:hypothetical protein